MVNVTDTLPLWLTWPFLTGLLLGLLLIVSAGLLWKIHTVREQNAHLQELVDDQKIVEVKLRESEERFRAMYENAAVGISLIAPDGHVLSVNPMLSRIAGRSESELITLGGQSITYVEDKNVGRQELLDVVAGKRDSYQVEKRYVHKDGRIQWMRQSISSVRQDDGKLLYLVVIAEDIDEHKRAVERLAAQEAEYRKQLERRIAERTDELNFANERLREKAAQDAVISERTRLARELHDAVTQTLFSTTLIADVLPDIWANNPEEGHRRLEEVRLLTRGALAEMRTLLVELRPNALVEVPLPTLLRQLTEAIAARSRIDIQLSTDGDADPASLQKLPADVQVGMYRLAQEALNNIVKHAKANHAVISLRRNPESVRLTVADNGIGFDPSTVTADHLGLKIMRERAEAIGAKLNIYSEHGEGTQISVVWEPKPTESEGS